ncbi:ATP-grasp domain-containing protein [Chengkuizengella sp. SCS-71B]|uniref:ATP-grasp domain-containing protein n=1 Tax=Chengkuizengella sp. SCS-71B TaxID=3115290 RepID=UPI0032C22D39
MKSCVIVDAYSSGSQLPYHFDKYGYKVIHVRSTMDELDVNASHIHKYQFEESFIYDGDLEKLILKLKPYHPEFVLPGAEEGVELSDLLSYHLDLIRNVEVLSKSRRDKFLMTEAVKSQGIKTVDHFKTNQYSEILKWIRNINKWPIVIKPINSASSDGVRFCNSKEEVYLAFHNIYNKTNILGFKNDEVLAQTYLEGTQYIINAISLNGQHYISDIWQESMILIDGKYTIYDKSELLESEGVVQDQLIPYVKDVLTALGIVHGPSHTEVMLTKEGPVLIETGARIMGMAYKEDIMMSALNYSHASLTADCYVKPEKIKSLMDKPYKLNHFLTIVNLISNENGTIHSYPGLNDIKNLPSFTDIEMKKKIGEHISITKEAIDHPGFIYLTSTNSKQIEEDYYKIRNLESNHSVFSIT